MRNTINAAPQKLQVSANMSPQNNTFLGPGTISANLRPFEQATIGDVRDSPCQMNEKFNATSPLAPSKEVPKAEITKYAGTIGLRTVATPAVVAARATSIQKMRLMPTSTGITRMGIPELHNHAQMMSRLPRKPNTAVR